jgi:hypothetical protein
MARPALTWLLLAPWLLLLLPGQERGHQTARAMGSHPASAPAQPAFVLARPGGPLAQPATERRASAEVEAAAPDSVAAWPATACRPKGRAGVYGTVLFDGEEPIPGAEVVGTWRLDDLTCDPVAVTCAADGTFFVPFHGLASLSEAERSATQAQLVISAEGLQTCVEDIGTPDEDGPLWEWEIWLDASPMLAVRVLDEGGLPVEDVEVTLTLGEEEESGDTGPWGRVQFWLEEDLPTPFEISAHQDSLGSAHLVLQALPSGPIDLVLTPRGRIEGTVLDPEGRPVVGIEVHAEPTVEDPPCTTYWAETDLDGRFALRDLPQGSYAFGVGGDVLVPHVTPDHLGLAVVSPATYHIVRIVDPAGHAVRGVELDVFPLLQGPAPIALDREARLRHVERCAGWTQVAPGVFGVALYGGGAFGLHAELGELTAAGTLQTDSPRERTLRLVPKGSPGVLEFEIRDPEGNTLQAGWNVVIHDRDNGRLVDWLGPEDDGEVPAGRLSLLVLPPAEHGLPQRLQLDIAPGEHRRLVLDLSPGAVIRVHLHSAQARREAASEATTSGVRPCGNGHTMPVMVRPVDAPSGTPAYSRTAGRAHVDLVSTLWRAYPPGRYILEVRGWGLSAEVEITDDVDVLFEFEKPGADD